MGIAKKLLKEIPLLGSVILVVVILSIVLLQFKTDNVCPRGYEYNATASTTGCVLESNNSQPAVTNQILTTLDTTVTGIQEPTNWTSIIVIVLVGVGVLALVMGAVGVGKGGIRFS